MLDSLSISKFIHSAPGITTAKMASGFRFAFFLCLTVGLLISGTASFSYFTGCPSGWTPYRSRCFIVIASRRTMIDAEKYCISHGGNLASVHGPLEQSFMRGLIYRTLRSHRPTWIGLFDAIKEREWLWTDGTKVDFTFWSHREPNNLFWREDCTEMNFRGPYWNDRPCHYRRPFVCAKKH